jgi:hypothetical protein
MDNRLEREEVERILNNLHSDIQSLRENGETDLRTVLHYVDAALSEINNL